MSEFVIATYEHEVKAAWNGTISDQDLFQLENQQILQEISSFLKPKAQQFKKLLQDYHPPVPARPEHASGWHFAM